MSSIFLTTLFALILFVMGCYIGYQVGSTRHIRQQLAKVRADEQN